MPMIHGETMKAVQELLTDRGVEHRPDEPWGDYVARGLHVSDAKAGAFLDALHSGCTIDQAKQAAGIADAEPAKRIARAIGSTVGKIRRQLAPGVAPAARRAPRRKKAQTSSIGATEDQVNMALQSPQRVDDHGTKPEDLAGTGTHDSQGG